MVQLYNEGTAETVMLPMNDGVKLQTTIWLPQKNKKFPVILKRSCYPGQKQELEEQAKEFCRQGFGFVYQWCRGIAESEGIWEPNVNERKDGIDTVNWLSEQPYVKNIGYWGDSYLALTGWCMIDAVQEKVQTMFLGVYGVDRHTSAYCDGMFRQDVLTSWAMQNAGKEIKKDLMESYRFRPQKEVDKQLWNVYLEWYREWISHPDRSDGYWKKGFWGMLKEIPEKVNIPLFIKEGWYDHHLGSALVTYELLKEEVKNHSILEIGPWNHAYGNAIPTENTENANINELQEAIAWFKKILVEAVLPEGCIREYVIGSDKWMEKKKRTECGTEKKYLYLAVDEKSGKKFIDDKLWNNSCVTYLYDPENPVMSHGCESLLANMSENGSLQQPEADWKEDVRSFISEPLEKSMLVDGAINIKMFVSSDAEDTAFTAKIMEECADGRIVNVRSGITTLAYRNSSDRRIKYNPKEIVEINIKMWDIAWLFRVGSRIRVDISSSDFPEYSIHTNYAGIWSEQRKVKKAIQTIYTGKDYPSGIEFPVKAI